METKKLVKPFDGPIEEFPSMALLPEGVTPIHLTDTFGYDVDFRPGIVYAERSGEVQHLHVLIPKDFKAPGKQYPLVVFIQGSAWHRQEVFQHLPHLIRVCQQGIAVAMVEYRPSEVAPFPAQAQDAKTAIRFMRKNAAQFHIDPERIGVWGDSSGAHTAVMAGFTADAEPDTDLYAEVSSKVRCIVDWYGPMDISRMNDVPSMQDHIAPDSPEGYLIGQKNVLENPDAVAPTIPMNYLHSDIETPPVLIMHGSRDQLVSFEQGCLLYHRLKELGKTVRMYKLEGAYHAFGGFNSMEAVQIVIDFLKEYLGES